MLRRTVAIAQVIAAPVMPATGISTKFRPMLSTRAVVVFHRLSQLRPAISSTESAGPQAVAKSIASATIVTTEWPDW